MNPTFLTIAGLAAIVTSMAYLGVLASLSARAGQESRLREFLRAREAYAGRLLDLRKKRVNGLKSLGTRPKSDPLEAAIAPAAGVPGAPPGPGQHSQSASGVTTYGDLGDLAKQAKEHPDKTASIIENFLLPKN